MKPVLVFTLILLAVLLPATDREDRLQELSRQMAELEKAIERLQAEKKGILDEVQVIELEHERENMAWQKMELGLKALRAEIKKKQEQISELEVRIEAGREKLATLMRVLYKSGSTRHLRMIFSVDQLDQLFRNYRYFSLLISGGEQEIAAFRRDLLELAELNSTLQSVLEQEAAAAAGQREKVVRIAALKNEKLSFLRRIDRQRDSHLRLLEEKKGESERLSGVLQRGFPQSRMESMAVGELRGRLDWPLQGEITSRFGRERNVRFNTYTINNGIQIKPRRADEIRAVYDGEVVFSDYFRGYGRLLIIQHARNFHTLYGHCDKLLAAKGERVSRGQVIAMAGSSGSVTEKNLYFELRVDLKPENPLQWLRKR